MFTNHVGFVHLRDEAPIILLCVLVRIFHKITSNRKIFVGGGIGFDCLRFLGLKQLPKKKKKKIKNPNQSSENVFITHFPFKGPHFLKMLVEIHSYFLHKMFKLHIFLKAVLCLM